MPWAENGLEDAFFEMDMSVEALMQLKKSLDGNLDLVTKLLNVVRPCAYEAHGEPPNASVDIHQSRENSARGKIGWAIAAWRGRNWDQNLFIGDWIDEIVVVSRDFGKVMGTAFGVYQSPVLGNPAHLCCPDIEPVRIFQSPLLWLQSGGNGVVMFGREREQVDWLRDCEAGIITDGVAHGERIQKMIRRDIAGPKILVASA